MSEQAEVKQDENKEPVVPASVLEDLKRAQAEAVTAALAEHSKVSQQETQRLLAEQQRRLVSAISGEEDSEGKKTRLLESFLEDPTKLLHRVKEVTKEEIRAEMEEIEAAREEKSRAQREIAMASVEALESRPDIKTNKEAKKLLDAFFNQTDSKLPPKDRIEQAVRDYDLMMERIDGKKPEERIRAATSVQTSSSPSTQVQPELSVAERNRIAVEDEMKARMEAFKKKSHGTLGRSRMVITTVK